LDSKNPDKNMGLDIVEFVIAVEGSFGVDIPDKDAETLLTPRLLADYIARRLDVTVGPDRTCLTQRAFYRSRRATAQRFGVDRRSLRPQTLLRDVLGSRNSEWKALRDDVGSSQWPRLKTDNWFASQLGGVSTLGELAQHLATYDVAAMRNPNARWTREEIEAVILSLLETELGVDMSKHTFDSQFVRDMGLG
jgi:acyl carrier protein